MADFFDIVIIGGGPAGLTAALYAQRAGKATLVLEKENFGGQIAASPCVENFPGTPALSGAELSERLLAQAESLGARVELETALEIRDGRVKSVITDYGEYTCDALILATGMKRRTLGLAGEDALSGVSFCAVCDGAFYRDCDVAVCGGGSTAMQDALFLSELCRTVTLVHRRDGFRGDPVLLNQLRTRENVYFALECVVTALEGETALSGLQLQNVRTGEIFLLPVSGLFEAVGQLPEAALCASLVALDGDGFIPAGEDCVTERPGVFVAGDCRRKTVRQLTTACADGAVAAIAACEYCATL